MAIDEKPTIFFMEGCGACKQLKSVLAEKGYTNYIGETHSALISMYPTMKIGADTFVGTTAILERLGLSETPKEVPKEIPKEEVPIKA
jgi:hypothetical protein